MNALISPFEAALSPVFTPQEVREGARKLVGLFIIVAVGLIAAMMMEKSFK